MTKAVFTKADGRMLYQQVSDFVREKIYAREWGVNEPIPSEHELMGHARPLPGNGAEGHTCAR